MNVVFLQDHLRGGGTERQSIALTKALIDNGHDARLVVGYSGGPLDTLAQQTLGSQLHFLADSKTLHSTKAFLRLAGHLPSTPHTLVCMGRWAHSLRAYFPAPKHQVLVSTVRTSRPLNHLYRKCIQQSNHLITNSQWAFDSTQAQCKGAVPLASVIHNGLSRTDLLTLSAEDKQATRTKLGLSAETKLLLKIARLEPGKGHADLLKAFVQLQSSSAQLWIAGTGPLRPKLEALAKKLQIQNNVRFLGFQENIQQLLAAADLVVSASQLDSLPNALLEAQAAALPVVAYPANGIPEIVSHQQSGLLTKAYTPEALAQAINQLLQSPEQLEVYGQEGRRRVTKLFDPNRQNAAFCLALQSLQDSHA